MKVTEVFATVGISPNDVRARLKSGAIKLNGEPVISNKDLPVVKILDYPTEGLDLLNDKIVAACVIVMSEQSFGPDLEWVPEQYGKGPLNTVCQHMNDHSILRYSKKVFITFKHA